MNIATRPNDGLSLLPRKRAALILGIEPQTLAVWACNKRYNLPYVKIGRRVMYRLADIMTFIESRTVGLEGMQ